jgi:SPP1 gp7 family putative phage head morphogenesis protein
MATPPDADVDEPEEAIAWFRKRVPITKEDWFELTQLLQERSFTLAGIAQLDFIAEIQEAIERSLRKGESLEQFKRKVTAKLTREWGTANEPHEGIPTRIETIFRNASQRAYQAGRREQLQEGDTLQDRPYLKFEPILDTRTTVDICRPLSGVVLPADHPFWRSHWPPLHHRCRSAVRSLTEKQAKRAGISTKAPTTKPDEGFGSVDPLDWKPDLKGYPKDLVNVYKRGR